MTQPTTPDRPARSCVVLAGGRSTRFDGGDKAVAELAGTPMIRRVVDRLDGVVDDLVVSCRAEQVDAVDGALSGSAFDPTFAPDETPDRGPMAGIAAGLRAVEGTYAAVVACDMPLVAPGLIEHLFERAVTHDAAVPRPDEWFETTQAVYRAAPMAAACEDALDRGERRIVAALADLDYVVVDRREIERHASLSTFDNVNTREELRAALKRL